MKKERGQGVIFWGVLFTFILGVVVISALPQVNLITLSPDLEISSFDSYNLTANVTNTSPLVYVKVNLSAINGEGTSCWDFYANGTCVSEVLTFNMIYGSEDVWSKTTIRPDYIYPEILFAPSNITWGNSPLNISTWRRNYHLFNFTNSFAMVDNMSFWIEFNVAPLSLVNSVDLFVYLIGNGSSKVELDYFASDWRSKNNTELVATISRAEVFHHTHNANSSHYLVALSTNADGTIGNKSINLSDGFWIGLYSDSTNVNKGWNLRYQPSSLCNNSNGWYVADRSNVGTWDTPVSQTGCPDSHIHVARRDTYADGLNATVYAVQDDGNISILSQVFSYGELPNIHPNPTSFTSPIAGSHYNESFLNITWNPATDPNLEDTLTYNISLLNSDESFNQTLNVTALTFYYWNLTAVEDGEYNLQVVVCDDGTPSLCVNSTLGDNFFVNHVDDIFLLDSIRIFSNNSNSSLANEGDKVTLSFNSTGNLSGLNVTFYSGGYLVEDSPIIVNSSNNYNASYIVSSADIEGEITFEIMADNLNATYSFITDSSFVVVNQTIVVVVNESSVEPSSSSAGAIPVFYSTKGELESNYTKILYKNWKIKFVLGDSSHTLNLDGIFNETAQITISSTPQTKNLSIGDEWLVELDGDDLYDVEVSLNSIKGFGANISLRYINLSVSDELIAELEELEGASNIEEKDETKSNSTIILITFVVLIIMTLVYLAIRFRKEIYSFFN